MTITLRTYQKDCIETIKKTFKKSNRQMISLPTGAGKTIIFSYLLNEMKVKTLILAHTKQLVEQTAEVIRSNFPELYVEIYNCNSFLNGDVVVSTFQAAVKGRSLDRLSSAGFKLVIIDECHRAASKSYLKIIKNICVEEVRLVGCTATPFRSDEIDLLSIFQEKSFELNILDMIQKGYLVNFKGYKVKTGFDISRAERNRGDFNLRKLDSIINSKNRNEIIVENYLKISSGEKAVAFCCSIKHASDLRKSFIDRNISCEVLSGNTSNSSRLEILDRFKRGEIKVLTNCQVLTEGFDEPSITTLLMARPTCSLGLYIQMIGRGSRLSNEKDHCKVIDFTDTNFKTIELEKTSKNFNQKSPMIEGEALTDYDNRIKNLTFVCKSTKVEEYEVIPKTKAEVGDYIGDFEIISFFNYEGKEYVKVKHTCGSTYEYQKNYFSNIRQCIFCNNLKEKIGKLSFTGFHRYVDKVEIKAICDCGVEKTWTRSINSKLSLTSFKKETNSCGCGRIEYNSSLSDKYVGKKINNTKILEKITVGIFRCECLKCNIRFEKTTKQINEKQLSCPNCNENLKRGLISEEKVYEILSLKNGGMSQAKIAKLLNINYSKINDICIGRTYKYVYEKFNREGLKNE